MRCTGNDIRRDFKRKQKSELVLVQIGIFLFFIHINEPKCEFT